MNSWIQKYFVNFIDQEYTYTVDKSIEIVRIKLNETLTSQRGWRSYPNIAGKIDGDIFTAYPAWSSMRRGFSKGKDGAEIRGSLKSSEEDTTRIIISASPDYSATILYVALTLAGIFLLVKGMMFSTNNDNVVFGSIMLIAAHTLIWLWAKNSKDSLRSTFEQEMNLSPFTPQT